MNHGLVPGQLPVGEKGQYGCNVHGGAPLQQDRTRRHRRICGLLGVPSQGGGLKAVSATEHLIESPHAAKAAGQCNLRHGQRRVGQQLLGSQQAAGLQVLQGGNAQPCAEQAAKMPIGDPQMRAQRLQRGADAGVADGPVTGMI